LTAIRLAEVGDALRDMRQQRTVGQIVITS
jgi:hypothetical protein